MFRYEGEMACAECWFYLGELDEDTAIAAWGAIMTSRALHQLFSDCSAQRTMVLRTNGPIVILGCPEVVYTQGIPI